MCVLRAFLHSIIPPKFLSNDLSVLQIPDAKESSSEPDQESPCHLRAHSAGETDRKRDKHMCGLSGSDKGYRG